MLERRFLEITRGAGLPRPTPQVIFQRDGRTYARVDFHVHPYHVVVETQRFRPDPGCTCNHHPYPNVSVLAQRGIARVIVQGSGLRTCWTWNRVSTNRRNPQRVQWLTWPGVLPSAFT
jgi:hypothetical protein